jgi:HK97 family phage major capsid protein
MPYKITKQDGKFCVVKKDDGSVVKCHPTEKEAQDHMAVLYSNVPDAGGKSIGVLLDETLDSIKQGARHSKADQDHGNQAMRHLALAGFSGETEKEPDPQDPFEPIEIVQGEKSIDLVNYGYEVKALGNGKIGGLAIRYSDETEPDLSRGHDWFYEKTYFGAHDGDGVDVTINHGIPLADSTDPEEKKVFSEIADKLLPPVKTKRTQAGLFAETVCNMADEFDAMVYDLASKGKLRWSTGAVGHQVKRTAMPNGTNRIDRWIIGEIALTPTPAEPRLGNVVPLKSYVDSLPGRTAAPNGAQNRPTGDVSGKSNVEIKTMADETTQVQPASPEIMAKLESLMGAITGVKKDVDAMKTAPVVHEGGIAGIIENKTAPAVVSNATLHEKYADEQLNALKAFMAHDMGRDEWKAHTKRMAEYDAQVKAAWTDYIRNPLDARKRYAFDDSMKASLVEGTASLGGDLVPIIYSNTVVSNLIIDSVVRRAGATIMPVSGTNTFQVPTLTRSGSAPIASELGAASQMEPTFSHQNFTAYAYRAQYIASREEMLDSRVPLDSILMENAGWQLTQSENNHFVIGTGSSQPDGIAHAASTISASPGSTLAIAFASASGADNVITLYHSLPYQYRDNAVWFANDAAIQQIRKIRVGSNAASLGDYIWQPGLQSGSPDRLLGRPVYTANNMATSGSTSPALVFCDPRFFWVADFNNGGMNFQVLNELYAASAAVGWWFWRRMDSHLLVAEAAMGLNLR